MRENTFKLASTQGYTSLGVIEDLHSLFYFNGLRAITQFLLGEDSGDSKSLASVNYVERMNVESRHEVLTKLWSILADWPHRFLAMCETYRSPYTRLVCERRVLPWWLYSVCSNELRRDPLAISAKEVQYIQHTVQDADGRFSFTAARKMYGRDISGHIALKSVSISKSIALQLFQYIDREISLAEANKHKRYALIRDKVMLLCGHHRRLTQKQLAGWFTDDVKAQDKIARTQPEVHFPLTDSSLDEWVCWYGEILGSYLTGSDSPQALFVSSLKKPMSESLIGQRFIRHARGAGVINNLPTYSHWARATITSA